MSVGDDVLFGVAAPFLNGRGLDDADFDDLPDYWEKNGSPQARYSVQTGYGMSSFSGITLVFSSSSDYLSLKTDHYCLPVPSYDARNDIASIKACVQGYYKDQPSGVSFVPKFVRRLLDEDGNLEGASQSSATAASQSYWQEIAYPSFPTDAITADSSRIELRLSATAAGSSAYVIESMCMAWNPLGGVGGMKAVSVPPSMRQPYLVSNEPSRTSVGRLAVGGTISQAVRWGVFLTWNYITDADFRLLEALRQVNFGESGYRDSRGAPLAAQPVCVKHFAHDLSGASGVLERQIEKVGQPPMIIGNIKSFSFKPRATYMGDGWTGSIQIEET